MNFDEYDVLRNLIFLEHAKVLMWQKIYLGNMLQRQTLGCS